MVKSDRNESGLVHWPTVRLDELREVERRRVAARLSRPEGSDKKNSDSTRPGDERSENIKASDQRLRDHARDLVGLAFSGGGIRSASFNLGLLQALQEKGLLRHVDLLSTVSGGGYIGSHLSSLALREDTSLEKGCFPLQEEPGGKQPARVVQFLRNGRYMVAQPLRFAGAYLVGTLLNNVVVLSGVLALCTLLALLWRSFDVPVIHDWIKSATFGRATDYHRPFIPAVIFFLLWLVTKIYTAYAAKGRSLVPTGFFAAGVISILVGIAVLLGNGDISGLGLVHTQWRGAVWALAGLLLVGLIPTLRPWRLLESGVSVTKKSDQLIFKIASTALLIGVPLAVIYFVSRENCSGFGTTRTELILTDIHDWSIIAVIESPSDSKDTKPQVPELDRLTDIPTVDFEKEDFASLREYLAVKLIAEAKPWINGKTLVEASDEKPSISVLLWRELYTKLIGTAADQEVRQPIGVLRWNQLYAGMLKTFHQENELSLDSDTVGMFVKQLQTDGNQKVMKNEMVRMLNTWLSSQQLQSSAQIAVRNWEFWKNVEESEKRLAVDANLQRFVRDIDEAIPAYGRLTPGQKQWLDDTALAIYSEQLGVIVSNADKQEFARLYLEAKYPEKVFNRRHILRTTVIIADQWWRIYVFFASFAVFIVSLLCIDPNWTSVHNYYRRQLAEAYIEPVNGFGREIPLCRLDTVASGAPYHIINTTINLIGKRSPEFVDSTHTFVFTRKYCGSDATGYCPTDDYLEGKYDLANAMAISGGALSPSQSHSALTVALMMILNLRLGQWLPNPRNKTAWRRPTYWQICKDLRRPAEERAFCFLSDGGHRENLGLAPLFRRRCKLIIVSDAGYDPYHTFADLLKLYRTARSRYGTQLFDLVSGRSISLTDLHLKFKKIQDASENSGRKCGVTQRHFMAVGIKYHRPCTVLDGEVNRLPEPEKGVLIYVKPSMVGNEEIDLLHHRSENPMFPHDPTSDVAFDEQQFESYRQLGHHIGMELCAAVSGDELWNLNSGNRCERLISLLTGCGPTPRDFGLWAENNKFVASNFQYALQALATGDEEVVTAITEWAVKSDGGTQSSCAKWCMAVEKILADKANSWSANTKAAIADMLDRLRHGTQTQSTTRKSSASKR